MTRRHLVTGAQGLVGRHLAARILAADPEAMVLGIGRSARTDAFFTHSIGARPAPLPGSLTPWFESPRYRYESIALSDGDALRAAVAAFRPDFVFHLASALHSAPENELVATNVEGTASLLRAVGSSAARIVLGSSASVYGHPRRLPMDENHPCAPVNPYGSTKLAAEQLLSRRGGNLVIARIFNVVGPGQTEDHVCGRLASQLARARPGAPTPVAVGPLSPTRDFIDVRDVAAALLFAADRAAPGSIVNVASGVETSVGEVLSALVRAANVEIAIVERGGVAAGVGRSVADVSRLRQLGFQPAFSIEQSLGDLVDWYRQVDAPGPGDQRGV